MFKNLFERVKKINRWVLIGAVVVIIAIIAVVGGAAGQSQQKTDAADTTVKAFVGDLTGSINSSGHLKPEQDVSLSMATTGIVQAVNVKVGDQVKAGDVLVQLDDADAQQTVQKAQLAVQQAQISVKSAQYDLNSKSGWKPNENTLAGVEANLANAQAAVKAAQSDYDKVAWLPGVSSTAQSMQLEQATNNYNKAASDMSYVLTNRPDITPAQSTVENAKLSQSMAEIDLGTARNALNKTTLKAPFDGTITAVNTAVGESTSGPVIEMVTMNALNVVLDIDEVDIGVVEIKQPAIITFDAYPGVQVQGEVKSIAPKAEAASSNDIVQYEVHVSVDKAEVKLLVGMTASATIQTYNLKNVLLVSNTAIFPNKDSGTFYVNLVGKDGKATKTDVTIGTHNGEYTQIMSGIKEGDVLQINDTTPTLDLSRPQSSGGNQ
jgi:HlyD family secretion protein